MLLPLKSCAFSERNNQVSDRRKSCGRPNILWWTFAFLLFFIFFGLISLSAQEQETEIFYKSLPIAKILSHRLGYKVVYRKSNMEFGNFYIPLSWFVAGGKGEMIFGSDPSYPYFSIFYKEGKFDFIRLYVQENVKSSSWGVLRPLPAINIKFEVEEIVIEY